MIGRNVPAKPLAASRAVIERHFAIAHADRGVSAGLRGAAMKNVFVSLSLVFAAALLAALVRNPRTAAAPVSDPADDSAAAED